MLPLLAMDVYTWGMPFAHQGLTVAPRPIHSGSGAQLLRGRAELQLAAVTRADGAQVVVAVDAGGVAVGEIDLNGVVAYRRGGLGLGLGLEHGQHGACRSCAFGAGQGGFFLAVVVTQSAGAVVAQIDKIVVARVGLRPGGIHPSAAPDVDLYAARFFPRVDGKWHRFPMLAASAGAWSALQPFARQAPGGIGLAGGQVFGWPRKVQIFW